MVSPVRIILVFSRLLIQTDSVVRGTTSREIIQMARDVGAKKIILASCAPPIRYSNVYGIDMPCRRELVAYKRSIPDIAKEIGADIMIYQTLPDLVAAVRQFNPAIETFDCSVFTGEYITGGIDEEYLGGLEDKRAESVKANTSSANRPKINGVNGVNLKPTEENELPAQNNGPVNGADDTVGLHNSWQV
jgi:amidophosphoribosyltransferase